MASEKIKRLCEQNSMTVREVGVLTIRFVNLRGSVEEALEYIYLGYRLITPFLLPHQATSYTFPSPFSAPIRHLNRSHYSLFIRLVSFVA